MKKFIHFLLLLLIIYIIYVMVDSIRIGMKEGEVLKPLVTLSQEEANEELSYDGIGYNVTYNVRKDWSSDTEIVNNVNSAEFKLFNLITLWKWSKEVY